MSDKRATPNVNNRQSIQAIQAIQRKSQMGQTLVPKKFKDQTDSPSQPSPSLTQASSPSDFQGGSSGNVKVVCRVRPFNAKEKTIGENMCIDLLDPKTIAVKNSIRDEQVNELFKFTFDRVFNMNSTQADVYEHSAKPVVESVLEGFNGTVFAYGQTSSGKTHTMLGPDIENESQKGIIPRMVETVFDHINRQPEHIEFTVRVSMVEIYMEKIRDLFSLDKLNLRIREDRARGIYLEDVTEVYVNQEAEVYDLMQIGSSNRAISATNMNEGSSRSHSIFMITVHQSNLHDLSAKTGRLYLVDLAGSEKIAKTGAAGQVLEEAKQINKSLSALGNVINALTEGKGHAHIPYRDSKLTRILQESLGGNSRTTLIITISPSWYNEMETVSTLRFGYRAKAIKNTPKINREVTVAELQLLLEKAEKTIETQKAFILKLQKALKDNGIALQKDTTLGSEDSTKGEDKKGHLIFGSYEELEDLMERMKEKETDQRIMEGQIMEGESRIRQLEHDLEVEQMGLRTQTEKLDILKGEFDLLNAKVITSERENEALILKLANMTLKMQDVEENLYDSQSQLEALMSLKEALLAENEQLRASNQFLMQNGNHNSDMESTLFSDNSQDKGNSKMSNKGDGINLEALGKDIAKTLAEEFNIENEEEMLRTLVFGCIDKVKAATAQKETKILDEQILKDNSKDNKNIRGKDDKPAAKRDDETLAMQELLRDLQEELIIEKENRANLERDFEKLIKDYDEIAKQQFTDFEQVKSRILSEASTRERMRLEKERDVSLRDLQNRIDKILSLEIQLDEEREKRRSLESSLTDGEKVIRKKNKQLEHDLEQVTDMYQKIVSQQTMLNLDYQVAERKIQRKTERVNALEKQLIEAKENVNVYKRKEESLKALISVSSAANISVSKLLFDNWESMEGLQQYKDAIEKEFLEDIMKLNKPIEHQSPVLMHSNSLRKSAPNSSPMTAKIVKHIRGGSGKPTLGDGSKLWTGIKQGQDIDDMGEEGILGRTSTGKKFETIIENDDHFT